MNISFEKAKELLLKNQVVALPTETVYGLGARFDSLTAIREIYRLKNRPQTNPLIVHIADINDLYRLTTSVNEKTIALCNHFWPGPLTLVLPANTRTSLPIVRGDLSTIAIRFPNHPLMKALIKEVGPIVAPSANLSGKPSATRIQHIEEDFGKDFPALESLSPLGGVESTILLQNDDVFTLGRLGAIPPEAFLPILGYIPDFSKKKGPICPGSHYKHYSPDAVLEMDLSQALDNDIILGYTNRTYKENTKLLPLGHSDDPEYLLQNLYTTLRELDINGIKRAFIDIDLPQTGLYRTLLERLKRASSKN